MYTKRKRREPFAVSRAEWCGFFFLRIIIIIIYTELLAIYSIKMVFFKNVFNDTRNTFYQHFYTVLLVIYIKMFFLKMYLTIHATHFINISTQSY